jgi:hypothetical protein
MIGVGWGLVNCTMKRGGGTAPGEIMLRSTHRTIAHPYGSWGSDNALAPAQGSDHAERSDPASQGRGGKNGQCCRGSRVGRLGTC